MFAFRGFLEHHLVDLLVMCPHLRKEKKKPNSFYSLWESFCCCLPKSFFWVQIYVRINLVMQTKVDIVQILFSTPFSCNHPQSYFSLGIGWSNTDPFRVHFHFCFWFSSPDFRPIQMKRTILLWTVFHFTHIEQSVFKTSFFLNVIGPHHCISKWLILE